MFEDMKRILRNYKQTTDRQYNDPKKDKRTNNSLQNITQNTKATRTPLKTGVELMWSGWASSSCSTGAIRRVTLVINTVLHR